MTNVGSLEVHLEPLEERGRQVIRAGTEILGGVLLTRTGIVVDTEENPEPYEDILRTLDDTWKFEEENYLDWERSNPVILKAINREVDKRIKFAGTQDYGRILRREAESRDLQHLTQSDKIGLSTFITSGSGICHQSALLSATLIRLLQQRGDIGGEVSLESGRPNQDHPDRHTFVKFSDAGENFTIDMVSGIHSDSRRLTFL